MPESRLQGEQLNIALGFGVFSGLKVLWLQTFLDRALGLIIKGFRLVPLRKEVPLIYS